MYILIGTDPCNCRTMREHKSIDFLRQWGRETLKFYAIYRPFANHGQSFHSSADHDFLIEHYRDPYWINNGVPSCQ